MDYLYSTAIGYFAGCISPSYIIGKIKGVDIKKSGSRNAGASNVLILFGKVSGILCALVDIFKAYFAILLTEVLFPELSCGLALTGGACIVGHIFPVFMRFRGGKGLACLGGTVLAFDWKFFLMLLAGEALLAFLVNYICIVPMTASVVFAVAYGVITKDMIGMLVLLAVATVIIFKHFENIKRIHDGTEARLSYLWNKDEKKRISDKLSEQ